MILMKRLQMHTRTQQAGIITGFLVLFEELNWKQQICIQGGI